MNTWPDIDWSEYDYDYIAWDEDGCAFEYVHRPRRQKYSWLASPHRRICELDNLFKGNWYESLIERPEVPDVTTMTDDQLSHLASAITAEHERRANELKPCPFCGGRALLWTRNDNGFVDHYYVQCAECDARSGEYSLSISARGRWNRRTP